MVRGFQGRNLSALSAIAACAKHFAEYGASEGGRELKGFQKVRLAPGETRTLRFDLRTDEPAFAGRDGQWRTEPGTFQVWIGVSSTADLGAAFELVEAVTSRAVGEAFQAIERSPIASLVWACA